MEAIVIRTSESGKYRYIVALFIPVRLAIFRIETFRIPSVSMIFRVARMKVIMIRLRSSSVYFILPMLRHPPYLPAAVSKWLLSCRNTAACVLTDFRTRFYNENEVKEKTFVLKFFQYTYPHF